MPKPDRLFASDLVCVARILSAHNHQRFWQQLVSERSPTPAPSRINKHLRKMLVSPSDELPSTTPVNHCKPRATWCRSQVLREQNLETGNDSRHSPEHHRLDSTRHLFTDPRFLPGLLRLQHRVLVCL
ncbi:hypothetical protein GWK47_035248 [Chionoecetes opilio]|uniref:Uncharacterized protein n=1 Tax=Chionoecetes opilio TaxID=41210 RepID=A0A8J4YU91_CHIOP|nr:hypothetical protein GWK47_035248 [Chionoecetes opilio]